MASSTTTSPAPSTTTISDTISQASESLFETSDVQKELNRLRKEVSVLRRVTEKHPELYEHFYITEAVETLKRTLLFQEVEEAYLREIAKKMHRHVYDANILLKEEDSEWNRPVMFIAHGQVSRWTEKDGVFVRVRSLDPHSMGSFHLLLEEPTRFNVRTDTECVTYELSVADFHKVLDEHPQIMFPVARALAKHIRTEDIRHETSGLLEQKGTVSSKERKNKTVYTATSLASTVESFYRSAMNKFMNAQLSGKPMGPFWTWFPQMHVQIPTRVMYINGLKELRRVFGDVETRDRALPQSFLQMMLSFAPGVIMCPISSVLEATHSAGNKEPMTIRWTRGFAPRLIREVLFGLGLNQLSDYCREQMPASIQNQHIRTALGSITSGVLSGYFSQIPHNLSTMKLLEPQRSYRSLWGQLARASEQRVPDFVHPNAKNAVANFMALTMPMGCLRRSLQIGGSFIILNGLIYTWRNKDWY